MSKEISRREAFKLGTAGLLVATGILSNTERKALALPASLRPMEFSGVENMPHMTTPDAWANARGRVFHRVIRPELFTAANNWGGAESWGASWGFPTEMVGAHPDDHGNPGQLILQEDEGVYSSTQGVTVVTDARYVNDFKWSTRDGRGRSQRPELPIGINLSLSPNIEVGVYHALTGQYLASGATNFRGDLMVVTPDNGAVTMLWNTEVDPTLGSQESRIWVGPHDDPKPRINLVDVRQLAVR